MTEKRVVSFLPSATELIYKLGAQDKLFGVTHECNYPSEAANKPRVIESVFEPEEMSSQEIDNKINDFGLDIINTINPEDRNDIRETLTTLHWILSKKLLRTK